MKDSAVSYRGNCFDILMTLQEAFKFTYPIIMFNYRRFAVLMMVIY